jgi:hypothetical protein
MWTRGGFALLCVGAVIGYLVYPTWPNYDSTYSLIWGRELLEGSLPSFDAYRAPTQHPLAVLLGAVVSLTGDDAAPRVWLALTVASYCGLVAAVHRLARVTFGRWVAAVAALLVLIHLDYAFLAARGYVDVPYLALVVWAAALETERPRRGGIVWVLLGLAGLLRPEAWVLAGVYWLWCALPAGWGERVRLAGYAAVAPVLWALTDLIVAGDPAFSLNHTNALAADLNRQKPASEAPGLLVHYLASILKWPIFVGALLGLALAVLHRRRHIAIPLAATASGAATFGAIAIAGLAVIDRYLAITALGLLVFAAFAVAGWTTLPAGHRARRPWMALSALVAGAGILFTVTHLHPGYIDHELSQRRALRADLVRLLDSPAFLRARRCGVVTVPNHKLVPDVRWVLDAGHDQVVARSGLRDFGRSTRGAHVFVAGPGMLENPTYGPLDHTVRDDARIQVPGEHAVLVTRTRNFAAYESC